MKRMSPNQFVGSLPAQKTILLYGTPGNGKTYMVHAIATELKLHFLQAWVGCYLEQLRLPISYRIRFVTRRSEVFKSRDPGI